MVTTLSGVWDKAVTVTILSGVWDKAVTVTILSGVTELSPFQNSLMAALALLTMFLSFS